MDPVSALIVVALLAGPAAFTAGVFKRARAGGRLIPSREDWKPRMPAVFTRQPATTAGTVAGTGKVKGGGKAKAQARPQTVPAILAQGVTDNWVARRAHLRANPKQPLRHRAFARLVIPGRRPVPQPPGPVPAPAPEKAPGETMTEAMAETPSAPVEPPSPISNGHGGGGGGGGGGGAGADFFHAITSVTGPAKAGGLKSKQRAVKILATGMPMMASALEEFARWCQEPAQGYGAPLVERLQKMANCIRAAGMEGVEADTYMTELAGKPLGEVAGSRVQAPSSREINTE